MLIMHQSPASTRSPAIAAACWGCFSCGDYGLRGRCILAGCSRRNQLLAPPGHRSAPVCAFAGSQASSLPCLGGMSAPLKSSHEGSIVVG